MEIHNTEWGAKVSTCLQILVVGRLKKLSTQVNPIFLFIL